MFAGEWRQHLTDAAGKPLGVVEDPRRVSIGGKRVVYEAPTAGVLLAVRGLRRQAQGDHQGFVEDLPAGLALARNLRHRSDRLSGGAGLQVEAALLNGLDRWLEKFDGRPELLGQALALLLGHEAESPPFTDQQKAEYLLAMTRLGRPEEWLQDCLPHDPGRGKPGEAGRGQLEVAAVGLAWQVPWEAERQRRILRALHQGDPDQWRAARAGGPPALVACLDRLPVHGSHRPGPHLCRLRAAQLKVALRLYQAKEGKPAERLSALVAKGYLGEVPQDPFDGKPFRYRLSPGEDILWPDDGQGPFPGARPGGAPGGRKVTVPAGQGILWSVGEDGQDDGGRRQVSTGNERTKLGEDRIFLVPLPPRKAGN
jgi:hypothetical protein